MSLIEGNTKSNVKNIDPFEKTQYTPPSTCPSRHVTIGYLHVIEDSHFWTDLKQMLEWLKYKHETVDKQYLKNGLENTLNNGYNLYNLSELIKQNPNNMI
jgi:hypothetical protein